MESKKYNKLVNKEKQRLTDTENKLGVTRKRREGDEQYRGQEEKGFLWEYMKSHV